MQHMPHVDASMCSMQDAAKHYSAVLQMHPADASLMLRCFCHQSWSWQGLDPGC